MIHGSARPTDQKEDSNNCCGFRAAGPPSAESGSDAEPADGQRPSACKEESRRHPLLSGRTRLRVVRPSSSDLRGLRVRLLLSRLRLAAQQRRSCARTTLRSWSTPHGQQKTSHEDHEGQKKKADPRLGAAGGSEVGVDRSSWLPDRWAACGGERFGCGTCRTVSGLRRARRAAGSSGSRLAVA
jgi:hypothetical protein